MDRPGPAGPTGLPPAPADVPTTVSGSMPVRSCKVACFKQATPTLLEADLNNFFKGVAVAGGAGATAYGANFIAEQTFLGLQILQQGTDLVAFVAYTD